MKRRKPRWLPKDQSLSRGSLVAGILISAALAADKVAAGAAEPFTAPRTLWHWPNNLSLFFWWAAPLGGKNFR